MRLLSEERLKLMSSRQVTPAWGADYQPAIRATPVEAPRVSRPAILRAAKVGRSMHMLSTPEVSAALMALYCPAVYDIHEQRLLSPVPASHPLQGSPRSGGIRHPALRGTVQVADSLGVLARHPKLYLRDQQGDGMWVPFPYVGDLLLFIQEDAEPYCVNWTVKLRPEDFSRPGPRLPGRTHAAKYEKLAELRHKIEESYYLDAGIRTVRVTSLDFERMLIANLRMLFGWHSQKVGVSKSAKERALGFYRDAVDGPERAYEVVIKVANAISASVEEAKALLYQAIWERDLKVDLFSPLLIDQPLASQKIDPMACYRHLIGRT